MAVTTSAVIGIAAGAGNAVQGFRASAEAKNAAEKARGEATKLMNDARRRAEVNNYEGLNIPLDAYEAKFENNLAADRQAIEALQEGDSRALAAGVGKIGAQQNTEAQATRFDMAEEMFGMNKMKADSKENIKQQMVAIDVGGATMADQIAYEEEQRRMKGLEAGMAGIGQVAEGINTLAPLYGKSTADKRAEKMMGDKTMQTKALMAGIDIKDKNAYLNWLNQQGITREMTRNVTLGDPDTGSLLEQFSLFGNSID